jgi:lipopolysaccharide export system protein LptA
MQRSDGNCGGVGENSTSLSVDRRSYLKLAGVAAGSVSMLSGAASAAFTRRGIRFERSVDMVADAGCDPTGNEPCDAQIQDAADSHTLLRFPPGEYKVTEKNVILNETNIGFLGEGDVRFVVPERFNEKLLVVDDGTGVLFENIDIDQRADGATPALHLGGEDDIQVHDVELIGQGIHPDSVPKGEPGWSPGEGASNGNPDVTDFFYPIVRSPDGTGLVTNLTANNHGLMGAYNAGDGRSGIWVGIETRGTVTLRDCHIEEFGSNGTYTSRTNGVVQFEGGVYRNNDNNQIRIGSTGSYIDGAVLDVDADASGAPNPYEALNYRGVRVEMGRQSDRTDVDIRDCDISVRSAPTSGGGVVAEATASEFTVRNSRIGIDEDSVRGVLGKEPDGGGAYDPPAKPHAAALENVSITGSADRKAGVTLFNRPDSVVDGCCIHQDGSSRDGVRLVESDGSRVTNSTIDVTSQRVVEENSSVRVNDIDASGSCSAPDLSGGGLPHTLTIDGAGSRTDYSFSVSGDLKGTSLTSEDSITESSATGAVGGGRDSYGFSGELVAFDLDGEANVTVDGRPAHVGQHPDHALVIDGAGSRTDYSFTVNGDLVGSDTITSEDSITGSSAIGAVGPGKDCYGFTGELIAFELDGKANVTVDGKPAHVGQRPDHVLTIDGAGSRTDYSFSVSGDLEGIGSLTSEDTITGSSATGAVGPGADRYGFSGELVAFDLDGEANVTIDGKPAHVGQYPDHMLTINGAGSRTDYRFSVSGDLRGESLTGEDDISGSSATGAVGGGQDRYAFDGNIEQLSLDSRVRIDIDRSARTISVSGTGRYTSYRLAVTGGFRRTDSLSGEDDISGGVATGAVASGTDTYRYTGEIRELTVDDYASVTIS